MVFDRRRLGNGLLAGAMLLGCGVAVVPQAPPNPHTDAAWELRAPAEISGILDRSCADCHSHRSHWPWYARLPIASNIVQADVTLARKRMNLSLWNRPGRDPEDVLAGYAGVCEEIKADLMPLGKYLLMHPGARLSSADKEALCAWTAGEIARLSTR